MSNENKISNHKNWAVLSEEYDEHGPTVYGAELNERLCQLNDSWRHGLTYGVLCRIAKSAEAIAKRIDSTEKLLTEALQPQIEEVYQRRQKIYEEDTGNIRLYIALLEHRHGPMPKLLYNAMAAQLHNRYALRFNARYARRYDGWTYIHHATDPMSMKHVPPCGPRSKTRKQYAKWIKQRRRKKAKPITPSHTS